MLNFGEALKQQRISNGLSQNQLAQKTGISQQNLSRWENEEKTPSIIFCAQLADFTVSASTNLSVVNFKIV